MELNSSDDLGQVLESSNLTELYDRLDLPKNFAERSENKSISTVNNLGEKDPELRIKTESELKVIIQESVSNREFYQVSSSILHL